MNKSFYSNKNKQTVMDEQQQNEQLDQTQTLENTIEHQEQAQEQAQAHKNGISMNTDTDDKTVDDVDEGTPEQRAIKALDKLSEEQQQNGKLVEALAVMEKALILRGHVYGLQSAEVHRACGTVTEMCNYLGMTYLQYQAYPTALELLRKAEVLSEKHRVLRAVTYNNLACYYRKRGKLRTALKYAQLALKIEHHLTTRRASIDSQASSASHPEVVYKQADTHLNLCTILSELNRHKQAIDHARTALKLLLLELFGIDAHHDDNHVAIPLDYGARVAGQLPPDRVAVLAIAYHNLAVQQEALGDASLCLSSYETALKVVVTHLGTGHPFASTMKRSLDAAVHIHHTKTLKEQVRHQKRNLSPLRPTPVLSIPPTEKPLAPTTSSLSVSQSMSLSGPVSLSPSASPIRSPSRSRSPTRSPSFRLRS